MSGQKVSVKDSRVVAAKHGPLAQGSNFSTAQSILVSGKQHTYCAWEDHT